jgi:RNA polymerase sigma-70 factor (ECF subfamily)
MSETSKSLLERLGDRADSASWQRLVAIYTPLILGWLRRHGVAPADAEDLTQEVLGAVVRELPRFRHNGRPGAFRAWLRALTSTCLRRSWRARRHQVTAQQFALLEQLDDPASDLSRQWDREHDRHVVARLLAMLEPDFRPATWAAFRRQVLDGESPETVAAALGLSINAVLIAKSRVLQRLRQLADGLVD